MQKVYSVPNSTNKEVIYTQDTISHLAIKRSIINFKKEYSRLHTMKLCTLGTMQLFSEILLNYFNNVYVEIPDTLKAWCLNKETCATSVAKVLAGFTSDAAYSLKMLNNKEETWKLLYFHLPLIHNKLELLKDMYVHEEN